MLLTYQNFNYIESPGLDLALAFQNYRPGQKPSQANLVGLAWPGLFWLGLAWLTASGQSRNITSRDRLVDTHNFIIICYA